MAYLDEIEEAYGLVRNGDTSQALVQRALQCENWQRLPDQITNSVLAHPDYHLLDAVSEESPARACRELVQVCQIPRNKEKIRLAYSLHRSKDLDSQFGMIDADDFQQLWEKLEKDKKRGKKCWITIDHLTLKSENDIKEMVCRLGLYPWRRIPLNTPVFCLELHDIDCVKPNALDVRLAFYFHQTPADQPGRTRNLETGEPDMEEWLYLEVDIDSIKCVGGCLVRKKVEMNMDGYYKNNAQRIRE